MNHRVRLRGVAILCCNCLRNIAFYRAGWFHENIRFSQHIWVNANGNFLNMAILEWCKLFTEQNGKHYWKHFVRDKTLFFNDLNLQVGMSRADFRSYATNVLRYRNKFVAHLDEERAMSVPKLRIARKSAAFLYEYLCRDSAGKIHLKDFPPSAREYYSLMYRHAFNEYRKLD